MPLTNADLNRATHAHLLSPATDSVYHALRAWRDRPNSAEWWWLIIEHDDVHYTALRFETLREMLRSAQVAIHMNTLLQDLPGPRPDPEHPDRPLPGVIMPDTVEAALLSGDAARAAAQASEGGLLVVLHDKLFRGIISTGTRSFEFTDQPLLALLDEFEGHGEDEETEILPRQGWDDLLNG
jgi:hypothetical protein